MDEVKGSIHVGISIVQDGSISRGLPEEIVLLTIYGMNSIFILRNNIYYVKAICLHSILRTHLGITFPRNVGRALNFRKTDGKQTRDEVSLRIDGDGHINISFINIVTVSMVFPRTRVIIEDAI